MNVNIYTLDNQSFESNVLRVHRSIEKKLPREIRTGQSTIREYEEPRPRTYSSKAA